MDSSRNQATWWKMILFVAPMILVLTQAALPADPVKSGDPTGYFLKKERV